MTEQDGQFDEGQDRRGGLLKAVKIPFVAWGISLIIHLLLLFFVTNIFWAGRMGLGDEGTEYEVGIAVGPGSDVVTTEAGAVGNSSAQETPVVEEMAFELQTTTDVQLQHFQSDLQADLASVQTPVLESAAMGQGVTGQGLWADVQLAGGGKGRGGASFFGLEAKGGKFIYVVDRSGSMSGQPLAAAKGELTRSIMSMGEDIEFFVFFYNTEPLAMPGGQLTKATPRYVTDALNWIEGVSSSGGTDPLSTMKYALSLKPDAIWLLSDGQFDITSAEEIRKRNPDGQVTIHTIAYFSRAGEGVLKKIAAENGGKYRFVKKP